MNLDTPIFLVIAREQLRWNGKFRKFSALSMKPARILVVLRPPAVRRALPNNGIARCDPTDEKQN